jgi:hypothetical protein
MSLAFPVCSTSIIRTKLTRVVRWIIAQVAAPGSYWRDGVVYLHHCGMDQDVTGEFREMYVQLSASLDDVEADRTVSGKSASSDQITRVLYLVQRFNPILEIADVECYHIG